MSKKVFANSSAIAGQAGKGMIVAAFPDVCMSPPSPPAGPVPVPYPDTSKTSDLKKGSKKVKIGGKPVFLSGQSYLQSKPLGNEASTKSFGASVLSHTNGGKTQFCAHSMDVKFEGKYVCRHLDLTTSNHASYPGGTPPFPDMEAMNLEALARIEDRKCPCCGEPDCPAAFQDGEEAQSLEDFYGFNKTGDDGALTADAADRMKVYKQMLAMKERYCSCDGQVFPSAPCDVFRAPNPARTKAIKDQWDTATIQYRTNYMSAHPNAIVDFIARNPDEIKPVVNKHTFDKVDHLTPKAAGGCPDNPGNLQPHDLLCGTCKMIDDQFGVWQGSAKDWRSKWNEAFRASGIKRRRISNFTPNWW